MIALLVFAQLSTASRLAGGALVDGKAYSYVQGLTDRVGQRFAGSPSAERAVEWAMQQMRAAGLKNVRREPVKVPRWIRGEAAAELLAPASVSLHVVALGGSPATPTEGITADVVEVASFDELKKLGPEGVKGKIVLYNKPMVRTVGFDGYGAVVGLRGRGAIEAARLGAVAALIRSVGTGAYRLPHTGATRYDPEVTAIPYAALAAEDADLIHRSIAGGEPARVKLTLGCKREGEAMSANVIGEVVGREKPRELVVLGAHLDSWDLGAGALDDGAGCALVLEAARLIQKLGAPPRRTIRVILFMNEEFGLSGARAYAEAHKGEMAQHVAAMEADAGAGRPLGFIAAGGQASVDFIRDLAKPLEALKIAEVTGVEETGADISTLQAQGVPTLGVRQDMSNYFDWHHTAADTLDKIDPMELSLTAAAYVVMAYGLADAPRTLPRLPPKAPK